MLWLGRGIMVVEHRAIIFCEYNMDSSILRYHVFTCASMLDDKHVSVLCGILDEV